MFQLQVQVPQQSKEKYSKRKWRNSQEKVIQAQVDQQPKESISNTSDATAKRKFSMHNWSKNEQIRRLEKLSFIMYTKGVKYKYTHFYLLFYCVKYILYTNIYVSIHIFLLIIFTIIYSFCSMGAVT